MKIYDYYIIYLQLYDLSQHIYICYKKIGPRTMVLGKDNIKLLGSGKSLSLISGNQVLLPSELGCCHFVGRSFQINFSN